MIEPIIESVSLPVEEIVEFIKKNYIDDENIIECKLPGQYKQIIVVDVLESSLNIHLSQKKSSKCIQVANLNEISEEFFKDVKPIAKHGDLIEWKYKGKIWQAEVSYIDKEAECYGVYSDYGQDYIPFDKAKIIPF